ncbi:GGDEF domain-containing protein [Thermosipho atlanticus]|uniref:Diguanylate cyclase (GGDEF) domain-containing protein n=1 Tax=Thermosipho atlanticus DSM 15807 TaxID=1123380 RepID=A0A1M5QY52_9BACT|nr:GGDEF domain-containing protein [Thermosipho atlanticus]SHH19127.1 diguanylate cyclase (GGDEF) domain-containing protein [Thermosipho atlanticus DSM 15807]
MENEFERRVKIAYLDSFLLYILQQIKDSSKISFKLFVSRNHSEVPENLYRAWKISRYYLKKEDIVFVDDINQQKLLLNIDGETYEFTYKILTKNLKGFIFELYNTLPQKIQKFLFKHFYDGLKVAYLLKNASIVLNYALSTNFNLETMIYAILTGITAGYSGAFNRCFMFLKKNDYYVFYKGLGPNDEKEAHEIWEAIETIEYSIEDFLRNISDDFTTSLEKEFKDVKIREKTLKSFLDYSKDIESRKIKFEVIPKEIKDKLKITTDIAIIPLKIKGKINGFLIADNKFDKKPIDKYQMLAFDFFGKQLSTFLENTEFLIELSQKAFTDALTGLENRRSLDQYLQTNSRKSVVIFIDLDKFKSINDTKGHNFGDQVLKRFGEIIKSNIRECDKAFRYGGDEFVIILDSKDFKVALKVLERIKKEAYHNLGLSFSAGVVLSSNLEKAIKVADNLVYNSKKSGSFEFYEGEIE